MVLRHGGCGADGTVAPQARARASASGIRTTPRSPRRSPPRQTVGRSGQRAVLAAPRAVSVTSVAHTTHSTPYADGETRRGAPEDAPHQQDVCATAGYRLAGIRLHDPEAEVRRPPREVAATREMTRRDVHCPPASERLAENANGPGLRPGRRRFLSDKGGTHTLLHCTVMLGSQDTLAAAVRRTIAHVLRSYAVSRPPEPAGREEPPGVRAPGSSQEPEG